MIEHRRDVESDFKEQHGERRSAQRQDDEELDAERKENLDGMKTRTGGYIDVQIGMVHAVKPPENRGGVKEAVLEVNRQIEHEQREQHFHPGRPGENVEQPPAARFSQQRKPNRPA